MHNRTTTAALITAGLLATLTACGSGDGQEGKTVDTPKPPAYTVANKDEKVKRGSVDLFVPDATVDSAKAAIQDYAKTIGGQFLNYSVTVVRSDADKVYVCMGEWAKDKQASQIYTGGRIKGDTWPAILMNCPDPKG
ncbi:hypothetical protein OG725_37415 [Streptomyces sp. NBC_01213]|uniref:hypothetical protein n=1 Tax=Streptomyces sp. NBC_01213 TaxID=2903776 RepID=UPI00352C8FB5|nr:hypothetical protein OG725_24470 [Streptomyces sp. NBC_01213]WSQ82783.1 hypothetical protein OG725_37415 [Streptomyces sp. NBC_01213]